MTGSGARALHYAKLEVFDARGLSLPAWMEVTHAAGRTMVRLVFDDSGAAYPITVDPLATTPAWSITGGQANGQIGRSVMTAGDINGDGFSDIIVGAALYDSGEVDEGKVFVYHGSPSGDPVFAGTDLVYTIDVSNSGPDVISVSVVDDLPSGVTFISAVPSQGACLGDDLRVNCSLGPLASGAAASITVTVTTPPGNGILTNQIQVVPLGDADPGNNFAVETTTTIAPALGDRVWEDLDGDGIQDPAEPGLAGVFAVLLDPNGVALDVVQSDLSGQYSFTGLTPGDTYSVLFFPPRTHVLSPADMGGNDLQDSDADPVLGETPQLALTNLEDPVRWDAGMVPSCLPPDEPIYVESVTLGGGLETIISFQDFNQPGQITGYNIHRSDSAAPPPGTWPLLASDIVDGDEGTPNIQWTDTTGDVSPTGLWFYSVTAYNSRCPAEGPF